MRRGAPRVSEIIRQEFLLGTSRTWYAVCVSQFCTESTLGTSSESLVERRYGHSPLVFDDVKHCLTTSNTIE